MPTCKANPMLGGCVFFALLGRLAQRLCHCAAPTHATRPSPVPAGRATAAIDVAKKVLAAYPQYGMGDILKQARAMVRLPSRA